MVRCATHWVNQEGTYEQGEEISQKSKSQQVIDTAASKSAGTVSNLTEIVELRVYFDWHMTNKRDVKWSNVL